MFAALLNDDDARRATEIVDQLLAHGLRGALTGGLAIEAHLRIHGRPTERRALNDVDFVVEDFASIPPSLAGPFLLNHIHPQAAEGKTLLQVIDRQRALRVDLFRVFGATLSRAGKLDEQTDPLDVVAVEDLVARTTAWCERLRRGRPIDPKHARAFTRLFGLGRPQQLEEAWRDHREDVPGSFEEVTREFAHLLALHPELVVADEYSRTITPCEQCQDHGPFRLAPADLLVEILGYW